MLQDDVSRDYDVFLSYAHLDADHDVANARQLAGWLESEGYEVWWDRLLQFGNWQEQLKRKADSSRKVILLWSPRAAASKVVFAEGFLAAGNGTLCPIIIEDDPDHPLPKDWMHFQHLQLTDFEKQKRDILAMLPPPSGKKARIAEAKDDARISIAALPTASGALIGRDLELTMLQKAWASTAPAADPAQKTNIVVLHAIGGAGKTALMRHFVDGLADADFAGAAKVYGWSAYSQGSGDNKTANADEFIAKALGFFGHDLARHPIQDAVERGRKLAHLVGERRSLLILDGLEPLQDPPVVNKGRLKDRALAALIKELAAHNKGLLVITSRQELPELEAQHKPRVVSHPLDRLGSVAGVALLAHLGVHGKRSEMEKAVEEVLGHALSLNLLGCYLDAVHGGDVNQREQFKLGEIEDAPADLVGDQTARYAKRAARIMEGTIVRFEELEGRTKAGGEAETAILHMVGLFDRPAEKDALDALLAEPAIPGLTDAFHNLSAQQRRMRWAVAVDRLRKLRLLNAEDAREPGSLDAHPIARAHFGSRLQHRAPEAFREAHSRLYDFYRYQGLPKQFHEPVAYALLADQAAFPDYGAKRTIDALLRGGGENVSDANTPETLTKAKPEQLRESAALIGTAAFGEALQKFLPSDLDGMRPCFSAIAHGCAAGRHQEAYSEVYHPRVMRGNESLIVHKLGALNADLAALALFFDEVWGVPAQGLREASKASVLNYAAFGLRALGRLREAVEPFEASLKAYAAARDWENAASAASSVSELRLTLGDVTEAIAAARTSVAHADTSGDAFSRMALRTTLADALHQAGQAHEAFKLFEEAEVMTGTATPGFPRLTSEQGYCYCDLLLARGDAADVISRAEYSLKIAEGMNILHDVGLNNLAAGRAHASLRAQRAQQHLDAAVDVLRRAGQDIYITQGLLARAAFHRAIGEFHAAATDLGEANEIAARGEMRLHLTDTRLESARLLLAQLAPAAVPQPAPRGMWQRIFGAAPAQAAPAPAAAIPPAEVPAMRARAEEHYEAARQLIAATGYKRRLPELDAIRACLDGETLAGMLGPDRDRNGRPAAAV